MSISKPRLFIILLVMALIILALSTGMALAQSIVDWWVIAGGGGPSSGGNVTLNATLGQPIVGPSSNGSVALSAGYWYGPGSVNADLTITKSVTPTAAAPGDTITYTLIFSNAGNGTATGVVITDSIPISVTATNVISSANASSPMLVITPRVGTRYVWDVSDLAPGAGGVITVTGALGYGFTGTLSYGLSASSFSNTATITTTDADSNPDNNESSASVTVRNVAPVAADNTYTTGYETTLVVDVLNGVLANDTDANSDPLTATLGSNPSNGTLSLNLNGSFTYTPTAGFSGADSFGYIASDGALTDTAIVMIDVGVIPTFTLTLAVDGAGSGTVTPTEGARVYDQGKVVTLTATPGADSEFIGWSGASSGTTNPVTLTMDSDKTVTATFDLLPTVPTYTLTVIVSPTMSGSVTLNPPGRVYAENTVVTMTAVPANGYEFVAWSGDLVSAANSADITMAGHKTVTANFDQTGFFIYLPLVVKNH
ncbi:MAG: DUF11 domain-containing protein [Chloroflexi bacterium]|nr:DUF11 domain-containing protein [Chloroflexota bacterium]